MTAMQEKSDYYEVLRTLSEASVDQHFDAFQDIAWDDPEFAIDRDDPRWKLPEVDPLGGHPWYQSLPESEQIRIGLYRQANIVKVGLQFEQILIGGLMNFAFNLRNGSPEFRYSTHEATEECHHTQMFQEFVNRSGMDVPGGSAFFTMMQPFIPIAARYVPVAFFFGVLAGEEPIDHIQKSILRSGADLHPLLERIMQIHVAEEARHIGFAHQYLEQNVAKVGLVQKQLLTVVVPVLMRWLGDEILKPSEQARKEMGMPDEVFKELYWEAPESSKMLRDLYGDVRMLVEKAGLMSPVSRPIWNLLGIGGRASRFRSEPAPAGA